jgi:nicotinate-nucleotide adenylyltransferase
MTQPRSTGAAQRIGMYGGAFDPPHLGHTALAQAAVAQLKLDVLHIIPTGHAWHKTRTLSAPEHRLAMTRLAFGDMEGVVVDEQEIEREGPSYTADTLAQLRLQYPKAQLYLVLGQDQAHALTRWKRWQEVAQNAIICIAGRAVNAPVSGIIEPETVVLTKTQPIDMPAMPQSSTEIRDRAAQSLGIDHLVAPPVARYIAKHQLYSNPTA